MRLVRPNPVVPDGIQRNHVDVVFDLLGIACRQSRKSAHLHTHIEIVALNVRRADVRRIGSAVDGLLFAAGANGRAIALLRFWALAVVLHKLRIIHVGAERPFNGVQIGPMPVRGELNAVRQPGPQVVHEGHSPIAVPAADHPRHDQLAFGFDAGPRPRIAYGEVLPLRRLDVLLLGVGERPDFVAPDALRLHATDLFVVERDAGPASVDQELGDGIDRNVAYPRDRPHRRSLAQHGEDAYAGFVGQPVHTPHNMNFLAYRQVTSFS